MSPSTTRRAWPNINKINCNEEAGPGAGFNPARCPAQSSRNRMPTSGQAFVRYHHHPGDYPAVCGVPAGAVRPEFRKLSPFALVAGLAVGLAMFTLAGPILRLWRFHDAATVAGLPIMLAFAWYPTEILFAYAFRLFPAGTSGSPWCGTALAASPWSIPISRPSGVWVELVHPDSIWLSSTLPRRSMPSSAIYLWLHREEPRRSSIPPLR